MRRKIALILALIGILFIKVAVWFDRETIRDVILEVAEKMNTEPPTRKPDLSGLSSDNVERYTMEDFEEPY